MYIQLDDPNAQTLLEAEFAKGNYQVDLADIRKRAKQQKRKGRKRRKSAETTISNPVDLQSAEIDISPFPKERPRVTENGTYMNGAYKKKKAYLAEQFGAVRVPGMVKLSVIAVRPIPKSRRKERAALIGRTHDHTPDADNIIGAVMDALFSDDSRVAEISCRKEWGDTGKLVITVQKIDES